MAKAAPNKDSKNGTPNPGDPADEGAGTKAVETPAPEDPAFAKLEGRYVIRHQKTGFSGVLAGQRFSGGYTATDVTTSAAELAKLGCEVIDRTTKEAAFKDRAETN